MADAERARPCSQRACRRRSAAARGDSGAGHLRLRRQHRVERHLAGARHLPTGEEGGGGVSARRATLYA
eukprot:1182490-Pleurochrysis_carterae.AAC.3